MPNFIIIDDGDGDDDLPSGQVAFINLHWGSVRPSKAEEKSFNLCNILIIMTTIHSMIIVSFVDELSIKKDHLFTNHPPKGNFPSQPLPESQL